MNKQILAESLNNANKGPCQLDHDNLIEFRARNREDQSEDHNSTNQWLIDHDAYAEALSDYKGLRAELEKAIGIKKDLNRDGPVHIGVVMQDYLDNMPLHGLLNRFEEAVIKKTRAKDKL
jgi:hypothetical protein